MNAERDRDGERLVFSGTLTDGARSSKRAVGLLLYCIFSAYLFSFHFTGAFTIEIWCCLKADNVMGRAQTVKPTGFPDDERKSLSSALFYNFFQGHLILTVYVYIGDAKYPYFKLIILLI